MPAGVPADDPVDPWATILDNAQLQPYQHAFFIMQTNVNTSLPDLMSPFREDTTLAEPADTDVANLAHVRGYFDASTLKTGYFLIVTNERVNVATGLFPCGHLPSAGIRAYWLGGDYIQQTATGLLTPPSVHRVAGALPLQHPAFRRTAVPAQPLVDIRTAYTADAALVWVPQVPDDPANPPEEISVRKFLPIHAKLAALFMRGPTIREALDLVHQIMEALPDALRAQALALANWMRVACTSNAAANPQSWLHTATVRVDTHVDPNMEAWHHTVVARFSPHYAAVPPYPAPGPPPETAPRLIANPSVDVLADLIRNLSNSNTGQDGETSDDQSGATRGNRYERYERDTIFQAAGRARPFNELGDESLPQFFRELIPARGKTGKARVFIDSYYLGHRPPGRMQYEYLLGSQTIQDLKNLDFGGTDPNCAWAHRNKGITMFALTPSANAAHDHAVRTKMQQYEDTSANHLPRDRAAHEALTQASLMAAIPTDRKDAMAAYEFFEIWVTIIFGPNMPLINGLSQLQVYMQQAGATAHITKLEWYAMFWRLHQGIRDFFISHTPDRFNRVVLQIINNEGVSMFNLPPELRQATFQVTPGSSLAPDDLSTITGSPGSAAVGSGGGGGGAPGERPPKRPRNAGPGSSAAGTLSGAPCAAHFKSELERAERGYSEFRARTLGPTTAKIRELFGPAFCALLPPNTDPCMRYWLFGTCRGPCTLGHTTTQEPTQGIINGIKSRVKARVDAIIAAHPNV